jgi:hypothetical protein
MQFQFSIFNKSSLSQLYFEDKLVSFWLHVSAILNSHNQANYIGRQHSVHITSAVHAYTALWDPICVTNCILLCKYVYYKTLFLCLVINCMLKPYLKSLKIPHTILGAMATAC